jgi:spermidine dehydrogenase
LDTDEQLGLRRPITRRDFLYGMPALAGLLAACRVERGSPARADHRARTEGLAGAQSSGGPDPGPDWYGPGGVGDYALSHGNTPEVLKSAHGLRDGVFDALISRAVDTGEAYDLVVVGGGFAGLAAAHHFRRLEGAGRCLILDNHPIFGGEAKLNEFLVDGHRLVGPQGSNDFAIPPATGGPEDYFTSLGLPRSYDYLEPEGAAAGMRLPLDNYAFLHWKADEVDVGYRFGDSGGDGPPGGDAMAATGDPIANAGLLRGGGHGWGRDVWSPSAQATRWGEPLRGAIARWRAASADEIDAFRRGRADRPTSDLGPWLDAMTMKQYYEQILGLPAGITAYVDPILASIIGLGCDAISAWWGWHFGLPGFRRVSRYKEVTIHCYPGGNTAIARHFVKSLIPEAIGGAPRFADILNEPVDFAALDRAGNPVRMRHDATVVRVEQRGALGRNEQVVITYVRGGEVRRLTARRVVMASGGWMNRHVLPGLPESHRAAYRSLHHSPVLVANVALRNWRFLTRLGFGACLWEGGLGFACNVRRPMRVQGESAGRSAAGPGAERLHPDDPIVMTFYVPYYFPGQPAADQGRLGRLALLEASFPDIERGIRAQMLRLFGEAGFDPAADIAGIILNRWGHAYVNPGPGFMFGADGREPVADVLRRPFGRIAIGHSELQGHQNWTGAAAEGRRAVEAVLEA